VVTEIDCNKLTMITKLTMFTSNEQRNYNFSRTPYKKMQKDNGLYNSPSLYDASGSPDFRNQTHNGFSVYRFLEIQKIKKTNLKLY
jgi:twinkle protein